MPLPDVTADQGWVQTAEREEGGTDRIAPARMEVGHPGNVAHAGQGEGGMKLLDRVTVDPGVVRGDQGDAGGQMLNAIAHENSRSERKKTDMAGRGPGNAKTLNGSGGVSINPGGVCGEVKVGA